MADSFGALKSFSLHKMCATLNLFDLSEGHPGV